jgi:hypothetical protein
MKRLWLVFCLAILIAPVLLFAQNLGDWKATYGDWKMINGRLTQLNLKAGMAMANVYLPQSGVMQYEVDVRYLGGLEDEYGGFGFHVFVDKPHSRKSWGSGKSYLFWLTYDPEAYGGGGVYGQAYKSKTRKTHSNMNLLHKGNAYGIPASYLSKIDITKLNKYYIPIKIIVDGDTGIVKVYDPIVANYYYRFSLGGALGKGLYVSVRTNSLAASFADFRATKLR